MLRAESPGRKPPTHSRLFKCMIINDVSLKVKKKKQQEILKQMECQAKGKPGLSLVMCDVFPKTKRGYLVKYVLMKVIDSLYAFFWNWQYFLLYLLEKANLIF